ncbi:MAG: PQQ-binding-like beta-propeller repeat protein [Verrucomicrobiota bacterium]|jgi:outer membrane protein assembly factor BamB
MNRTQYHLLYLALAACLYSTASAADQPPAWDNLPPATADAADWPWWRGPALDNHTAPDVAPPLTWSTTNNVAWRVALPGKGHATPCIRGNRIFVPVGDRQAQAIWMLCLDRASGKTLWQTRVYQGPFAKIHDDNSPASATPACDGERVIFPFQTEQEIHLVALDLEGRILWDQSAGAYKSIQGYSASPALFRSAVIIPNDGSLGNELVAFHRQTGKVLWRTPLTKGLESYASPLVLTVAGRPQAIIIGGIKTSSFDPATGKRLWVCDGPADYCAATPVASRDTVYITGGYPQKALLAIRADGADDVTPTHVRWKSDSKAGYVPSPLLQDDLLYAVGDTGLMRCYDSNTGTVIWSHDFKAPFYSSPVLAGNRVYVFDRKGKGYVVAAGRKFELLAVNELPSGAFATPVILGNRIYLRTLGDFFCLGGS